MVNAKLSCPIAKEGQTITDRIREVKGECTSHKKWASAPKEKKKLWHEVLVGKVKELGYVAFEGAGVPASPEWNPEVSLLILGIDEDTAVEVGEEFGQNAIVLGWQDEVAELVACRGR